MYTAGVDANLSVIEDPQYDPLSPSSSLYGQVLPERDNRQLVLIDPKTAQVERVIYNFPEEWGIPLYASTFDPIFKIYYTFGGLAYGSKFIVGVDVESGDLVFNVTIQMCILHHNK